MTSDALPDQPRVVAFGGGHGLAASLAGLRRLTSRITAVVTVGDDGGSSGRLREELGMLPPGDLRMALATLAAEDPESARWADLLQHRFGGDGHLAGHAIGNLLLAGLVEMSGNPVAALDAVARLVKASGRVLPLSPGAVDIAAMVSGLDPTDPGRIIDVRGQVAVATVRGRVETVRLLPDAPPACAEAIAAVREADALVLGPGSLYTSMLPHLLVPEMSAALTAAPGRRILVLNLAPQPGETDGFAPETHLEVLGAHAPALRLDVVVADPAVVPDPQRLADASAALGARLQLSSVGVPDEPRHDAGRLADAFRLAFGQLPGGKSVRNEGAAGVHKPSDRAYRAVSPTSNVPL